MEKRFLFLVYTLSRQDRRKYYGHEALGSGVGHGRWDAFDMHMISKKALVIDFIDWSFMM
jgi:hypothetical protein